ncbi:acyl-CoA N-acyltransferase [Phellopilus nigrolimitatus]|nr:acyl-CoA N-acyltransferase [Phellopilus nigrolimitatus]
MKVNQHTALIGRNVILVPYRREHVEKYHAWMADPELRELTASEPLSLEEEYEMQRKWQEDEDKLTFIVLARDSETSSDESTPQTVLSEVDRDPSRMIGDVNLFFKGSSDDEDFEVEAEVMIAESKYRRRGYASEALQLILSFATSCDSPPMLPVAADKLVVRIGAGNAASVGLFAKLGFTVTKHVAVFDELEMRIVDARRKGEWVKGEIASFE